MRAINSEYYGDSFRWFVATVIDGSPPTGLEGRIRIRIHGVHSEDVNDIPQADLPWAQVMTPSDTYGVSGYGTHCQILPGALVFGMFLDGAASQLPLVLGSLPRVEYPTTTQAQGREDISTNPFSYQFNQTNAEAEEPVPQFSGPASSAGIAINFFIDNGFKAKDAAAIVATLQTVSKLDPKHDNGDEFGIASWPKESRRFSRFFAYASRLKPAKELTDFDLQLFYVLHELKTTHTIASAKMTLAKEIQGSLYGEKIDGIDLKGNGKVAALWKYYLSPQVAAKYSQGEAEGRANKIYNGLGAR
jgi:hypothetical protein